jgi:hypothetical protein
MTGKMTIEAPFFDAHTDTLHELFVVLGREEEWCDDPKDLLPYTQAKWVGSEHGDSVEKDQFTPDQEEGAKILMPRLGLQQEVPPPPGSYDQIIVGGGFMRANRERIQFTKQLLDEGVLDARRIIFWAGQRCREQRDEANLETMDLAGISENSWVAAELSKSSGFGWGDGFATETQLARLAYLEHFPDAELGNTTLAVTRPAVPAVDVPPRKFASYTFAAEGYPGFTIMNCAAARRPKGSPRPTIASCVAEWLQDMAPPPGASVLVVAGNPHTLRHGQDLRRVSDAHERSDIHYSLCGPAAHPAASLQLYLGEIGRLLYMDVRAAREAPIPVA